MSDFGKGFIYPLILWTKHFENSVGKPYKEGMGYDYGIWFNGASDHLYEFNVPDNLPEELKEKCNRLKDRALDLGHGSGLMSNKVTEADFIEMVKLTKEIALDIDKWLGVETEKGEWE